LEDWFIYFLGHGEIQNKNRFYLIPYDWQNIVIWWNWNIRIYTIFYLIKKIMCIFTKNIFYFHLWLIVTVVKYLKRNPLIQHFIANRIPPRNPKSSKNNRENNYLQRNLFVLNLLLLLQWLNQVSNEIEK
jgi:hypothetical protein